jgi:hypothetical protein
MRKWTTALALVLIGPVSLSGCATAPNSAEGKALLGRDVATALSQAKAQDPSLQAFLDNAYGYGGIPVCRKGRDRHRWGVWPGRGVRARAQDRLLRPVAGDNWPADRRADIHQIIAFQDKAALEDFKKGTMRFAGQATVVRSSPASGRT